MAEADEPTNTYPVTKTEVGKESDDDARPVTKTEEGKEPDDSIYPVTKTAVVKEFDENTHHITKTEVGKDDDDTNNISKTEVGKKPDDDTHPVIKTEVGKKTDDDTHPVIKTYVRVDMKTDDDTHLVIKTEVGKKIDDDTHPVTKTEVGKKTDDDTHPVIKTEVGKKIDDDTHPVTNTELGKKTNDDTRPVTKTEVGKEPDDDTHPVIKTEVIKKRDDDTHPVTKTEGEKEPDDDTHTVTKTEVGKKSDADTHPVTKTEVGKEPDDDTHPVTKTGVGKKSNDDTHPVTKTEIEKESNNAQVLNNDSGIHGSDEVIERYCEPCRIEHMTEKATRFCYTCLDYICSTCSRYHSRLLPDHQHVNIDDIPPDMSLEHCSVHKNEIIKFFCSSCNSLLCFDCKLKTHQGQGTCVIELLVEYVDKLDVESELNKVVSDTHNIFKKLSETAKTIKKKQENLEDPICKITKDTEAVCTKFVRELHALELKISMENESQNERFKLPQERMEFLKSEINKISATFKQLALPAKYQKCKIFMDLRFVKLEAGMLDATIDDLEKECTPKPDLVSTALMQKLNDMIEDMEKNVLGKYDLWCKRTSETSTVKVATPIADINAKASCDTEDCDIIDFCILGQQYIVACDKNNNSVKLLDLESKSVVYVRSVKTRPCALTKINDREIALARTSFEEDNGIIEFLTLTESRTLVFQKKRRFYTSMFCTDVVFYQNSLIVSMHLNENEGKIEKFSMWGDSLCSSEEDTMEDKRFCFPDCLAIDPVRKHLYVSDYGGTIIQTQCDDMTIISNTMNAWKPQGITVDEEGFVYVCETGEELVRVFDFDHESSYTLIESDSPTWSPQSIYFNELDSKLYVGNYNSNYIKVYKIEKKEFVKCKVLERVEKWLPM